MGLVMGLGVRLIVALSLFIGLLYAGSKLLWQGFGPTALPALSADGSESIGTSSQGLFFYESIGRASQRPDPAVSRQAEQSPTSRFTLELYEAKAQEEAQEHLDQLRRKGLDVYYSPLKSGALVVYKVRYGLFATESLAREAQKDLASKWQVQSSVSALR